MRDNHHAKQPSSKADTGEDMIASYGIQPICQKERGSRRERPKGSSSSKKDSQCLNNPMRQQDFLTNRTVLVLIKLTKFAVAVRLRCGSCKLIFFTLFHHFLLNLRTLYIVWRLVRRRVTRRLTRLQTMSNGLKYRQILENVALRLRCGCVYFFNLFKTSTVSQNNFLFN